MIDNKKKDAINKDIDFDILKKIAEAGTEDQYKNFLRKNYNEYNLRRSRCDRENNPCE